MADELLRTVRPEGQNPDVFSYKIGRIDERSIAILKMVFYGGFGVLCLMKELEP